MGELSSLALIGRIGDAVIERFRGGAVESLVAPENPATLRLSVRFAEERDRAADLARLSDIAISAGIVVERDWATPSLITIEMPVGRQSSRATRDRVVCLGAASRRRQRASRV